MTNSPSRNTVNSPVVQNSSTPEQTEVTNSPSRNIVKSSVEQKQRSPLTPDEVGILLALWAEHKTDCAKKRENFEKITKKIKSYNNPITTTGSCVMGKDDKIIAVEGSGYIPAACYLAIKYPSVLEGSKVYLSKYPSSNSVKTLIQAKVAKIIIPYFANSNNVEQFYENNNDDDIKRVAQLIQTSSTGFSRVKLSEDAANVFDLLFDFAKTGNRASDLSNHESVKKLEKRMDNINKEEEEEQSDMTDHEWLMACAIIISMRSKDKDTKVGSVVASFEGEMYHIIGIGCNGTYSKALVDDFPETEKEYFLHAEPNAMMFRNQSLSGCNIYTTYSSCEYCAPIILDFGISRAFHVIEKKSKEDSTFKWETGRKILKKNL